MITEDAENAKSQAQRAWRNEEAVQLRVDSNRSRRTGQTGRKDGSKPFSTYRDDREGGNISSPGRQGITGGIVDRLISKVATLIEESEARTADLKEQLEELKQLSQQFQKQEKPE